MTLRVGGKRSKRTLTNERGLLLLIWSLGSLTTTCILLWLYLASWIESDTFESALRTSGSACAPFLTLVTGYYFGGTAAANQKRTNSSTFAAAIISSVLFCGVLVLALACIPLGLLTIEGFSAVVPGVSAAFGCVTAPSLGYYFAKRE